MACLTGDETGIVKIWDIRHSASAPMTLSYGTQSRDNAVLSMCWVDGTTTEAILSRANGSVSVLNVKDALVTSTVDLKGLIPATPASTSVVDGKLCTVAKSGGITLVDWGTGDHSELGDFTGAGPATAVHIHRRLGLVAMGGRENNLTVWDVRSERRDVPLFAAESVVDPVLQAPLPVYVCGVSIVSPSVFVAATALNAVQFFDSRVTRRPVQEFKTSREMDHRATTLTQWNCNKFLIGETSGDIHLYDTRRGFASRAKFRGGVGSVRQVVKHPAGHKIIAVIGLDRKARLYHVPTGRLILSVYIKQKGNSVLLSKDTPFLDQIELLDGTHLGKGSSRAHQQPEASVAGVWDEMEPVCDDVEAIQDEKPAPEAAPPQQREPEPALESAKPKRKRTRDKA